MLVITVAIRLGDAVALGCNPEPSPVSGAIPGSPPTRESDNSHQHWRARGQLTDSSQSTSLNLSSAKYKLLQHEQVLTCKMGLVMIIIVPIFRVLLLGLNNQIFKVLRIVPGS